MTVWCVVADAGGAHEAQCVYSIWSSGDAAMAEIRRLREAGVSAGRDDGEWYAVAVTADAPSDEWIQ